MMKIITISILMVILAACTRTAEQKSSVMISATNYEGVVLGAYPSNWRDSLPDIDTAILAIIGVRSIQPNNYKRQYWFHDSNKLTIILIPITLDADWKKQPLIADGGSIIYIDYDISEGKITEVHENAPL